MVPPSESCFLFRIQGSGAQDMDTFKGPLIHLPDAARQGISATLVPLQLPLSPPDSPPYGQSPSQASRQQTLSHWQVTMMDGGGLNRMLWIWPGFLLCWLPVGF